MKLNTVDFIVFNNEEKSELEKANELYKILISKIKYFSLVSDKNILILSEKRFHKYMQTSFNDD